MFFLLPLSLISYHALSGVVGVSLIVSLCFLVCLLAHIMYDREDLKFLIVFAYGAIMAAFLSPTR